MCLSPYSRARERARRDRDGSPPYRSRAPSRGRARFPKSAPGLVPVIAHPLRRRRRRRHHHRCAPTKKAAAAAYDLSAGQHPATALARIYRARACAAAAATAAADCYKCSGWRPRAFSLPLAAPVASRRGCTVRQPPRPSQHQPLRACVCACVVRVLLLRLLTPSRSSFSSSSQKR